MSMTQIPEELRAVVKARSRKTVDELDYRRALVAADRLFSQRLVARAAGITQPSLSSALKTAEKVPPVREGFSGATPTEICQRYAAGDLDRAQLVDELTRWTYGKRGATDGVDWLAADEPGNFGEVERAADEGLIEEDVYDEIVEKLIGPVPGA
ncbi:hypothetical protein GCM10011584_34320 [Nocardioides phosphati]|uniref:XRE family transcriptional regulator n=1 Tax=Nocardioides phosphati TaxID=1867775 RepID=A0ABQ2NF73_9ACTN|nr:hypothetical protein [Nocardioides phosphati]GGO94088.1 hypothetical protein GCM10011584_34320 [Nocardioides phosphati]